MTDNKPMMLYTATYDSVSAAMTDLDAIEQLHKDKAIGQYDAAVIDKENGKAHIAKRGQLRAVQRLGERGRRRLLRPTSAASSSACWRRES